MTPSELWPLLDAARRQAAPPTVLVCAGRRLAPAWLADDAQRQVAGGHSSWLRAPIASFDAFVRAVHEQAGTSTILSAAQEAVLWRAIVDAEPGERPLLRIEESARLAMEAWRLAQEWRLALPFSDCNGDVAQFNRWAQQFRNRVQRMQAVDAASIPARLEALIDARSIALPSRIVLAGFDEPTPSQSSLFSAMQRAGCEIATLTPRARRGDTRVVAATDREREIRAAASWSRAHLERDANARIGIVVPDLRAQRADLERIFGEVLTGGFNIATGEPLADVGLVRCALRLLAARQDRVAIDDATALLLSPYWGASEEEQLQRAELDRWLRDDGYLESGLQDWLRVAQRRGLTLVAGRVNALIERSRAKTPSKLSSSGWTEHFSQWLVTAGWPGPRAPDSDEFQALAAWNELLAEYGALSAVLPSLAASAALAPLREAASRRLFQPRTPAVPVQILSALDADGLQFDRLWMLGLDDERWPPPARPHPFIPFALQRAAQMPRSSGAQQTALAERVLARLRNAADEVVLSHPQREDDLPLAPSPLLAVPSPSGRRWPDGPDEGLSSPWPSRWQTLLASARTERIDDARDPLATGAAGLRGGTSLFRHQAICAFRGYATHRLRARRLEEPGFGPSALDRGNMVHKTMERLWRRLGSQEQLLAIGAADLQSLIAEAVDHGVQHVAVQAPHRFGDAMIALERGRLAALVQAWLAMERTREPFRVIEIEGRVLGEENTPPRSAKVAGIEVTLRPDRVDVLETGEQVVLDYKTGKALASPWYDERPDEPQLLIYGLQQPALGGVAFAILRAGKVVFRGVSGPVGIAAGFRDESASSWEHLRKRWDRELALLAEEIRSGVATVTPKTLKACDLCDLHALCHIRDAEIAP
ncbi:MAG TPA: PD-(D/E)XK nuclease family protein [Nevskiaceae bacterium]|nr:PD-(D/E)XK nuclease family protein [Nevskiaceae bacterium]